MYKVATWNVNSLNVRLEQVISWLTEHSIDVLAVQETKLVDEKFPVDLFRQHGYEVIFSGQKTYNGVALITRHSMVDCVLGIPDFIDEQRRVIAATIDGIRYINVYVPNGAALGTDKYLYKMSWLNALYDYLKAQLAYYPRLVLMGDFNIAPTDQDVHDPVKWEGSVLVSRPEREALERILSLGLVDCFRDLYPDLIDYTWWDYRAAGFRRNHGLRIDLILMSTALHTFCQSCHVDRVPRKSDRPSDHAPVWAGLHQHIHESCTD